MASRVKRIVRHMVRSTKRFFTVLLRFITQPYRDFFLRTLIRGKRVLVLASGPSAVDLPKEISSDVLIFACNTSPSLLLPTNRRNVGLYIANKRIMTETERLNEVTDLLSNFSISIFLFRAPEFIKKHTRIKNYKKVLLDRSAGGRDDYYTKKFLGERYAPQKNDDKRTSISTGVGLLLYALYYGAIEVYLIGMDLDGAARISDKEGKTQYAGIHDDLDTHVVRETAKRYDNIFVASKKSPLVNLFSYKELK